MYFWKTDDLIDELRKGSLSQADRFKYLFVMILITVFLTELMLYMSEVPSVIAITESIMVVTITIFGMIWCYQTNKLGDNSEFLDRFICLSLPITVRLFVFFVLIYTLYIFFGTSFFGEAFEKFTEQTNWIDVIFTVAFSVYFYWRLSIAINEVANKRLQSDAVTPRR